MKNIILIFVLGIIVSLCAFTPLEKRPQYKLRLVVIDAGHGGKDPGTHGKYVQEKEIALKVALEVGKTIKKNFPDVKVLYTRMTDKFVDLQERAAIANRNHADLFISIHCNSNNSKAIAGTETYTMGLHTSEGNLDVAKRENSAILLEDNHEKKYGGYDPDSPMGHILFANYQSAYMENSLRFASHVESQFEKRANRHSRGVRQAGFIVLWKTTMPSALIEIGFLSNLTEEKYLRTEEGRSTIANSIYRGFKAYKEDMEATD
ncbi:N-acetylmuramoyl-L-alanine amidase [Cytophagaceae bacterium YF14B1]|uniref:N-acetylmuramoyl-L-alanine amidase n=1 Tax=Xanthocytophaga flava TaxID=3048013 RepID=A0AAE3U911_9BACT|nr:N-acetylmuramoyl-L-alanine amidase [Xanthocytophaga flavus]MDJ1467517.1 N-acetylmuramoyl-L-alanine amidase [Xanthocytophaga flavus]MDJ1484559.1 N-acetylmuramoyl-L-alanine amidase [Xanthocytophaga flavus]